jgi:hypothetical protein
MMTSSSGMDIDAPLLESGTHPDNAGSAPSRADA